VTSTSSSSDLDQVDRLRDQFLDDSIDEKISKSILDLLADNGDEGIAVIQGFILDSHIQSQKIKNYALELINRNKNP
jgi:NaMN:DMB phosphoribosyltransferase